MPPIAAAIVVAVAIVGGDRRSGGGDRRGSGGDRRGSGGDRNRSG